MADPDDVSDGNACIHVLFVVPSRLEIREGVFV